MALGTRTEFQLEIFTVNVISGVVYFREIILESSRNVSETTPWNTARVYLTLHINTSFDVWPLLLKEQNNDY